MDSETIKRRLQELRKLLYSPVPMSDVDEVVFNFNADLLPLGLKVVFIKSKRDFGIFASEEKED